MAFVLLTILLVGMLSLWIVRKARGLDPRADHSDLLALIGTINSKQNPLKLTVTAEG